MSSKKTATPKSKANATSFKAGNKAASKPRKPALPKLPTPTWDDLNRIAFGTDVENLFLTAMLLNPPEVQLQAVRDSDEFDDAVVRRCEDLLSDSYLARRLMRATLEVLYEVLTDDQFAAHRTALAASLRRMKLDEKQIAEVLRARPGEEPGAELRS